jgi:hypothetical protein
MNAIARELDSSTRPPWIWWSSTRTRAVSNPSPRTVDERFDVPFHAKSPDASLSADVVFTYRLNPPFHRAPAITQVRPTGVDRRVRALSILDGWLSEETTQDAAAQFEQLKQELQADRTSKRRLFSD